MAVPRESVCAAAERANRRASRRFAMCQPPSSGTAGHTYIWHHFGDEAASTTSRRARESSRVGAQRSRQRETITPSPARARTSRTTSVGTPYPPSEPTRRANTVVITRPCASTTGPPELPLRVVPRRVVTRRLVGNWPYASRLTILTTLPTRTGVSVYGPLPG